MIGRIMIASTRPAVSMVRPVDDAGPANSGMNPALSSSQRYSGTSAGARVAMPQKP